jgi:hypothetical protein
VAVMARAGDGEAAHWRVDFWIADADAAAARATELDGSVVAGPDDAGPFREAVLADPAGATFSVSQRTAGPSRPSPLGVDKALLGLVDRGLRGPLADALAPGCGSDRRQAPGRAGEPPRSRFARAKQSSAREPTTLAWFSNPEAGGEP